MRVRKVDSYVGVSEKHVSRPEPVRLWRFVADDYRWPECLSRAVPQKLWDWLVDQTTMMITIKDDDAAFVWVKEWFLEQKFLKRIRRVDLDTTMRTERVALSPAPGTHWFWYSRRPFLVYYYRSEGTRERAARRIESLTFRTLGRKQTFLPDFVDDVVACHVKRLGVQSPLFA